jgi:hypothetical protein
MRATPSAVGFTALHGSAPLVPRRKLPSRARFARHVLPGASCHSRPPRLAALWPKTCFSTSAGTCAGARRSRDKLDERRAHPARLHAQRCHHGAHGGARRRARRGARSVRLSRSAHRSDRSSEWHARRGCPEPGERCRAGKPGIARRCPCAAKHVRSSGCSRTGATRWCAPTRSAAPGSCGPPPGSGTPRSASPASAAARPARSCRTCCRSCCSCRTCCRSGRAGGRRPSGRSCRGAPASRSAARHRRRRH